MLLSSPGHSRPGCSPRSRRMRRGPEPCGPGRGSAAPCGCHYRAQPSPSACTGCVHPGLPRDWHRAAPTATGGHGSFLDPSQQWRGKEFCLMTDPTAQDCAPGAITGRPVASLTWAWSILECRLSSTAPWMATSSRPGTTDTRWGDTERWLMGQVGHQQEGPSGGPPDTPALEPPSQSSSARKGCAGSCVQASRAPPVAGSPGPPPGGEGEAVASSRPLQKGCPPSLALAHVFSKQLLSAAVSAIVLDALTDSTKAPMIHSTAATRGKEKASQRHRCVSGILDDEWGVPAVHAGGHLCEGPTSGYPLVQGCKGGPAARAAQQTQGPSRGVHPSEFRPCLPPPPPPPACRPWQGAPGCRSPEELLLVDGSSSQFVAGPGPWKSRA